MSDDDDPAPPPPGGASGAAKAMLGLMGLAILGVGGWAAWAAMEDDPDVVAEPAFPELPEPAQPRTRAMVASGTGFGWRWVNPRPRAMPTWHGVDVAAEGTRMVMVGAEGAAVRYEDETLFRWSTGTRADLHGVAWTGAREALVVGDEGVLHRLGTESGPEALQSGVRTSLRAVVATSPSEAIAVGDEGTLLRIVGEEVRRLEISSSADLVAALARGHQTFVVGSGGTVLRVEGRTVATEASGVDTTLRGVGGCADGAVYAAGDQGVLLRRRAAGGWGHVRTTGREAFTSVSCDHGRVAVARANGEVWLVSGDQTLRLPTGFDRAWHALRGGSTGPTWLVGTGGRLATVETDHVWTRSDGPAVPLRALGSMGGALVAVGEYGRILRERERGLERVESPTESGLAALVQLDEGHLIALGDFGAIVDVRFDRATLLESPTDKSLRGGVTDAEGQSLLLVGAEGVVVRGALGLLSSSRIPDVGDLWAITGTPERALAVGEDGVVLRFNAEGFSRVACGVERTLRDVTATADGTWAVGDGGLIVRIEGGTCVTERSEGEDLHAIGAGPAGQPIVGGDRGVVLERSAEGEWSPVDVDVGGASIRAVWRSSRSVYLAGTRGALVRHVRLDL